MNIRDTFDYVEVEGIEKYLDEVQDTVDKLENLLNGASDYIEKDAEMKSTIFGYVKDYIKPKMKNEFYVISWILDMMEDNEIEALADTIHMILSLNNKGLLDKDAKLILGIDPFE